jgi:hypothetical protein
MAIMLLTEVNKLLEKYGKDSIEAMNKALDDYGIENLQKSMTQKVEGLETTSILTVQMAFYGEYIDSGRKAGSKFPPPNVISDWCDRRGIGESRPGGFNTLTYPISRKIAIDGIEPRPFLNEFTDLYKTYDNLFAEALKKDVLQQFDKIN